MLKLTCLRSLTRFSDIAQSRNIASLHYQIKNCDDILAVSMPDGFTSRAHAHTLYSLTDHCSTLDVHSLPLFLPHLSLCAYVQRMEGMLGKFQVSGGSQLFDGKGQNVWVPCDWLCIHGHMRCNENKWMDNV